MSVITSGSGRVLSKKETKTKNGSFVLYLTIGSNGYDPKEKEKTNIVFNCSFFGKVAESTAKYIASAKEVGGKKASVVFYSGVFQKQEINNGYINNFLNINELQIVANYSDNDSSNSNENRELTPDDFSSSNNTSSSNNEEEDNDLPF